MVGATKFQPRWWARILKDHGVSLRGNVKTVEGKQHPDRDGQFRYINEQVATFLDNGEPVISVDTKKKLWWATTRPVAGSTSPPGSPVAVDTYDFIRPRRQGVPLRGL
jgi:hypothetical protein